VQLEATVAKVGKAGLWSQGCRNNDLFLLVIGPLVSNVQVKRLHIRTKALRS